MSCLFAFSHVHGVLGARILEWVAISPSSGSCFVRTLHYDPSILGSPAPLRHHSFIQSHKSLYHDKAVINEGGSIFPTGNSWIIFAKHCFKTQNVALWSQRKKKLPIESTDSLTLGPHPWSHCTPKKKNRRRKVILGGPQGSSLPPRLASPVPSKSLLSHRIILSFLRLQPNTASWTLLLTMLLSHFSHVRLCATP